MSEKSFFDETMELLAECPLTNSELAAGAGVNKWTLAKIRQGVHKNPGVRNVEKIRAFLLESRATGWSSPSDEAAA